MTEEEELEQLMQEALDERDNMEESTEEETLEEEVEEIEPEEVEIEVEEEDTEPENEDEVEELDEEESEESEEEQANDFTPIEIEVSGHNVTINSQEEMMEYIKKGAGTFNTEPDKYTDEKLVIEQGKLSSDDLKLLVEAKNGSKEAIAKLAEMGKVDVMEIDEDTSKSYRQQVQYEVPTDVDKVASEILKDEAHATDFRNTFNNLPKDFQSTVSQDAGMLSQFSEHVKSGIAKEIIPKAINASMTNGKPFIQNYAEIGQEIYNSKQESVEQKRHISEQEQKLRARANSSKGVNNSKATATTADDIHDMTDAEFAEYTADPSNFE